MIFSDFYLFFFCCYKPFFPVSQNIQTVFWVTVHNFVHRGSLTRYLDLFESLKSISGMTDETATFYL